MTGAAALRAPWTVGLCGSGSIHAMLTPAQRRALQKALHEYEEGLERTKAENQQRLANLASVVAEIYNDPDADATQQEIADEIGYTRERVAQWVAEARRKPS